MDHQQVVTTPPGEVEEMANWNIRAISVRARKAAVARAGLCNLSVGDWLEQAIDRHLAYETGQTSAPVQQAGNYLHVLPTLISAALQVVEALPDEIDRRRLMATIRKTTRRALLAAR